MGNEATYVLAGSHLSSGVGSEGILTRLFVGFWCEDTCPETLKLHFHKISYISHKHTINSSSHTEDIYSCLKRKELSRKTFPFVFLAESDR
jgi:hypothetical protein